MKIFSGIQPTGNPHIGNYLGAIKQWVELQDEDNQAIYCIVDEHAITVPQDPETLQKNTLDAAMICLAAGINPDKSIVFIQSHVPAHAELGWILNTMTPIGELERMTQYKEKKEKSTYAGLFNYPTLMAADILLYRTEVVPVGEDQVQHIELARSLAERFNNRYGETFVIPKPRLKRETARIMSLTEPEKKMSKSDESNKSRINLTDSLDTIREKIKSAVTDSGNEIKHDPETKPAISNLINLYAGFSGNLVKDIEGKFSGKSYAEFKEALAEVIVGALIPFQQRYNELQKEKTDVLDLLKRGAEKASAIAEPKLKEVKQKIGLIL